MDLNAFLDHLNSGKPVQGGSEAHLFMHGVSQEALRLTAEINGSYHEPEELRSLFSQLIGRPVDETFGLFPPWAVNFRIRAVFTSGTARSSVTMWCWQP